MMQTLKNLRVLVTGATGGIGQAIANQLADAGAQLVLHYFQKEDTAQEMVNFINNSDGVAHALKADLSKPQEAIALGEKAWDLLNGIDVLINNSGVSYKKHFLDTTPADVDYFLDINYKGTLWLTHTIATRMVNAHIGGSIYTITSINGIQPGWGFSLYGSTKGALETLMKGVALELAPHGIKVNTIAPGAIQTDINAPVLNDELKLDRVTENIPMKRIGTPDDVAKVVCGLMASDSYMTGVTITIDGGWLLKHGYAKPGKYNKDEI